MVQRRGGAGFAAEAFENLRILGSEPVGKELESDKAAEVGVFRLVDDTHTATAKNFQNAIVRDGLPDERVGVRHINCDRKQ
jgi:hypothetical protein